VILYGDTCALIKLYVHERGSAETIQCVAAASQIATSHLTLVEIEATLSRALKAKRLSSMDANLALTKFHQDWLGVVKVPPTSRVVGEAAKITGKYALRAYDAIHLASAIELERLLGAPVTLGTFDDELWNASVQHGIPAWPRSLAPFR
jgi:predicted nucleic acid-binding protein